MLCFCAWHCVQVALKMTINFALPYKYVELSRGFALSVGCDVWIKIIFRQKL